MEEEETHNAILLQIQKQTQIHIHTQTQLQKRKVVAPLVRGGGRTIQGSQSPLTIPLMNSNHTQPTQIKTSMDRNTKAT